MSGPSSQWQTEALTRTFLDGVRGAIPMAQAQIDVRCDWLREIGYVDVDCFFKVFELALFGGRKPVGKRHEH